MFLLIKLTFINFSVFFNMFLMIKHTLKYRLISKLIKNCLKLSIEKYIINLINS